MKKNKRKGLFDCYSQIVFDLLIVILVIIAFFSMMITSINILIEGVFHQKNKKQYNNLISFLIF